MKRILNWVEGTVEEISELETFNTKDNKKCEKRIITLVTEDNQRGFFEMRNNLIVSVATLGVKVGSKIQVGFVFVASTKLDRKYNNFFINEVRLS